MSPLVLRFFSAVSVNGPCPLGAVSQAVAPDACTPTISTQFQRVYVDLLVGVPQLSNRSYLGKPVCTLPRGLHFGLVHTLTSGSFAGLRPGLTASVFTTRKLSVQSSNTLMKMLRGAP
jgi:hypothetical protein